MRFSIAILFLFLFSIPAYSFESELAPFELNHIFAKESTSVALYKEPSKKLPIIRKLNITKDEEILIDRSKTRTIKSGKIKVNKEIFIQGISFGTISYLSVQKYLSAFDAAKIKLEKGDIIEELHHAPEGNCVAKWQKKVLLLSPCPWYMNDNDFNIMSQPTYEWWVRITKNNKPIGWLLVEEKTPVNLY